MTALFARHERISLPVRIWPIFRKAFVVSVLASREAEHERHHRPIWPELEAELKAHGMHNYSICFHAASRQFLAYVDIEDEALWSVAIAKTAECAECWAYLRKLMSHSTDGTPVTESLRKVFHLE